MISNCKIYHIVLFLSCFLKMNVCSAQWNIFANKEIGRKEIYSIHNEKKIPTVPFFFPEVEYEDSTNVIGYKIMDGKHLQWTKEFETFIPFNIDSTCLFFKFYSENINTISITFTNDFGESYSGEIYCNELYNVPILTNLGLWKSKTTDSIKQLKNYPTLNFPMKSLTVSIIKKDNSKPYKLFFTDFSLFVPIISKIKVLHPFFDQLTQTSALSDFEYNSFSTHKADPIILNTFDQYCLIPLRSGHFYLEFDSTLSKKTALYQFASLLFDKYPFYIERNINKRYMRSQLDSLFLLTNSIDSLVNHLRMLIALFRDPHFYIQTQPNKESSEIDTAGPVALQRFYNHVYVAAVFDSVLIKTIPLGSRVLEVDHVEIEHFIDSLSNNYSGSLLSRKNKALSRLLYRKREEQTVVKSVYKKDTIEVVLSYNKTNIIPQNFRPIDREYRILNDNVAYFRLNNWFLGDWLSFYNHLKDLKKRKGLIIDLRNNGGGFMLEGMRIASCFIKQPEIYSHSFFPWNEENSIRETSIIKPNHSVDLSHIKVIILGNERTACASEIFIDFMQRNAGALFVGTNNTAGAYANLYSASILNEKFYFNSMVKSLTGKQKCIEVVGIQPDIYVTISKVEDLYPYNDKVLQTGIYLLSNQ